MKKSLGVYWLSDNSYHLRKPIPAIWRNKDFDIPIKIMGILGKEKGIHYLIIEGSKTGVPINEVVFE